MNVAAQEPYVLVRQQTSTSFFRAYYMAKFQQHLDREYNASYVALIQVGLKRIYIILSVFNLYYPVSTFTVYLFATETRLPPALNDILIAHPIPAAVSRFRLSLCRGNAAPSYKPVPSYQEVSN